MEQNQTVSEIVLPTWQFYGRGGGWGGQFQSWVGGYDVYHVGILVYFILTNVDSVVESHKFLKT